MTSVLFFLSSYVKGRKRYSVNLCEVIYVHVCQAKPKVDPVGRDPSGRVNEIPAFPAFFSLFHGKKKKTKLLSEQNLVFPKGVSHQGDVTSSSSGKQTW